MIEKITEYTHPADDDFPYETRVYAKPIGENNDRELWIKDVQILSGTFDVVGVPPTLSFVFESDRIAANARIAALEAENARLRQAAGALERLEEWMSAAGEGNERMYKIEAGRNWAGVLLFHNGVEILGRGEPTIAAAIDAALKE